jgi:hypothetical protein
MKKTFFVLSLIFVGLAITAEAKVWRLNNQAGVSADFTTTLQAAIDGVSSGDTIYVEQSPLSYGPAIFAKKVILIGAGYWLAENDSTNAYKENSIAEYLVFNPGSEGSVVMSMFLHSRYGYNGPFCQIIINADNITLRKNYIFGECFSWGEGYKIQIKTTGQRSGILIEQNWINAFASQHGFYIEGTATNIVIRNNFIRCNENPNFNSFAIEQVGGSVNFVIKNNVIFGSIKTYNALHINNILLFGTYSNGTSGLAANNLCNETQYPATNNNKRNINMSTVFIDYDKYIDNGYFLSASSPAKNAGFNGGDCGAFTTDFGGNPYILSGMANIPAIFGIEFNNTVFPSEIETLEINVKAKSHN